MTSYKSILVEKWSSTERLTKEHLLKQQFLMSDTLPEVTVTRIQQI